MRRGGAPARPRAARGCASAGGGRTRELASRLPIGRLFPGPQLVGMLTLVGADRKGKAGAGAPRGTQGGLGCVGRARQVPCARRGRHAAEAGRVSAGRERGAAARESRAGWPGAASCGAGEAAPRAEWFVARMHARASQLAGIRGSEGTRLLRSGRPLTLVRGGADGAGDGDGEADVLRGGATGRGAAARGAANRQRAGVPWQQGRSRAKRAPTGARKGSNWGPPRSCAAACPGALQPASGPCPAPAMAHCAAAARRRSAPTTG